MGVSLDRLMDGWEGHRVDGLVDGWVGHWIVSGRMGGPLDR